MIIGIISGDIVNSRHYPQMFSLPYILNSIADKIKLDYQIAIQIYKGDEFTITVKNPAQTISVYVKLIELLEEHSLKATLVSTIGTIDHYDDVPGYCYGQPFIFISSYLNYIKSLRFFHNKINCVFITNNKKSINEESKLESIVLKKDEAINYIEDSVEINSILNKIK